MSGSADPSADAPPSGTGADLVYEQLREAILHARLEPGLVISQVLLAKELGVSRTPLREALRMLQREGLVEGEANRRVRIAPLTVADIEELYAVRMADEALGIRLTVPGMTAEDDAFLEVCLRDMKAAADASDIELWHRHHRDFHARLVRGGGRRLRELLAELYDHAERCRRLYIDGEPRAMSVGAAEHESLVSACHDRDGARAATELARHLSRTALTVLMLVAPEHEPAMLRSTLRWVLGSGDAAQPAPRLIRSAPGTSPGRR